jgi:hypothetical protein
MPAITSSEVAYLLGSTYISQIELGNDETKATRVESAVAAASNAIASREVSSSRTLYPWTRALGR